MIFTTRFQLSTLCNLKHPPKIKSEATVMKHQKPCLGFFRAQNAVMALGLWHLLIHLFGFILFVNARYLMPDYCSSSFYGAKRPSTMIRSDSYVLDYDDSTRRTNFSKNLGTWSSLSLFSFLATCFLIRGAMKGKSTFILPFLLIQVFDILFDFFTMGTYILLSSTTDEFFSQLQTPPFQRLFSRSGFRYQRLFILIFIAVSFSMKTFLMRMVYSYFKSLNTSPKTEYLCKNKQLIPTEDDDHE